jgi:signal transduction histidine kinase
MYATIAYNQRTVSLAQLIAGMNHEIRNWVSYVEDDLQILRNGLVDLTSRLPNDPAEASASGLLGTVEKALVDIRKATQRLTILKRFRWREEDLSLSVTEVEVNALLQEVVRGCMKSVAEKGIVLEYALDSSLPVIRSDPSLIEECASNLLLNAVYFTPRSQRIVVGSEHKCGDRLPVRFWVHDQGGGIHKKDQERIFLPFFSTKQSVEADRERSGSGIGLFLTRVNVGLLGGEIELQSAVPSWSRFIVKLPVKLN